MYVSASARPRGYTLRLPRPCLRAKHLLTHWLAESWFLTCLAWLARLVVRAGWLARLALGWQGQQFFGSLAGSWLGRWLAGSWLAGP